MDIVEEYFDAFFRKDIPAISSMLDDQIVLQDPVVGRVSGKNNVLGIYEKIFEEFDIEINIKRTYSKTDLLFAVEFSLVLIDKHKNSTFVDGVDLIELSEQKIISIRAYLDTSEFAGNE